MKAVACKLDLEGAHSSSAELHFKQGEETLQVTHVAIQCHLIPQLHKNSSTKEAYVPHKKRDVSKKIVVRVVAHVRGPTESAEREHCVAAVALRHPTADDGAALPHPVTVVGGGKLDLRFQMETVRFTAHVTRVGYWNMNEGHHQFGADITVMGTTSPLR